MTHHDRSFAYNLPNDTVVHPNECSLVRRVPGLAPGCVCAFNENFRTKATTFLGAEWRSASKPPLLPIERRRRRELAGGGYQDTSTRMPTMTATIVRVNHSSSFAKTPCFRTVAFQHDRQYKCVQSKQGAVFYAVHTRDEISAGVPQVKTVVAHATATLVAARPFLQELPSAASSRGKYMFSMKSMLPALTRCPSFRIAADATALRSGPAAGSPLPLIRH